MPGGFPWGFPYSEDHKHSPEQVMITANALIYLHAQLLERGETEWRLMIEQAIGHLIYYAERERRN